MHLDPFYPQTLREEELKNKVDADWFGPFDCTRIIGNGESVMPFINANWDILKRKYAIYDRDFYLAGKGQFPRHRTTRPTTGFCQISAPQ